MKLHSDTESSWLGAVKVVVLFGICALLSNLALRALVGDASHFASDVGRWLVTSLYVCGLVLLLLALHRAKFMDSIVLIAIGYASVVGVYPTVFFLWWERWSMTFGTAGLPAIWVLGGGVWGVAILHLLKFVFGDQCMREFWNHVRKNYTTNGRPKG